MHDNLPNKKEQLQAIITGKGVQHILDEAYKILENPMLIHDMEYKLVASPDGVVNDDQIWNEFMVHGFLSDATIEFCVNESFVDSVANCTNFDGVTYLFSDKLKYDRIFGQLYNHKHMPVADLCMVACEQPFEDNTPELIKTLCDILSKELSKSKYYQDYGQAYQENIIKKLIEGDIENKAIYTGHVANLDDGLETYISLAVVDISRDDRSSNQLVYFRDLFKQIQNQYKYYIYSDYIVILTSSKNESRLNSEKDWELSKIFKEYHMFVGLSSPFENLFALQQYYHEAIEALHYGIKSNGSQRIFFYNDKGISPLDN